MESTVQHENAVCPPARRSGISRPAGGSFRGPQYPLPLLPAVHARRLDSVERRGLSTVSFCSAPGPKGIVSGNLIPSLGAELRLTRDFLDRGLPVIGIGIGACILSTAAAAGPRRRRCVSHSTMPGASFPTRSTGICRKRFRSRSICAIVRLCPAAAKILAVGTRDEPVLFQIGDNCFGFVGHPGIKSAHDRGPDHGIRRSA